MVNVLASRGVEMVKFDFDYKVTSAQAIITDIMDVDVLSNFDHWQRSGLDDEYEAPWQWPLELRRARLISAVDYVQVGTPSPNSMIAPFAGFLTYSLMIKQVIARS